MTQYKVCSQCKQNLPFEAFGKIVKSSTGRRSACNKCRTRESRSYRLRYPEKKQAADKQYRIDNSEKVKKRKQLYASANAEYIANWQKKYRQKNKEAIAKSKQEWRKKNSEWADDASRRWQQANKDLVKQYKIISKEKHPERDKNYYLSNPAKFHANRVKRRYREKMAKSYLVTNKDIKKIMNRPCAYCGGRSEHLDHVIPLVKGGQHKVGNLVAACAKCNLSKGGKFVSYWRYR